MMPFFEVSGKATRKMPGADGADSERNELERKHTELIYKALQRIMRYVAPTGTTTANITPDIAVRRYNDHQSILRDALVAMLTDGAILGADIGRAQTDWLMGVGKAVTITGVDWDLINDDVLRWVTGGGEFGSGFGQGYADTVFAAMNATSERQLRTLLTEWVRNDLTYRQLTDSMQRTLFSRNRAEMVATTEITRSYAEGNRAAWQRGGIIEQMEWRTAGDEIAARCPICGPLNGQTSDVRGSFGGGYFPPAHPRCRCMILPVVSTPSLTQPEQGAQPQQPNQLQYAAPAMQINSVNQLVDSSLETIARRNRTTPAEVEARISESLNRLLSQSDMSIQAHQWNLYRVIEDGRFKTQFETGQSGGAVAPVTRAEAEEMGIGIPSRIDPKLRPVYGFMNIGENAHKSVSGYGDITFVLRPEVRDRTTVTVGDSLMNFVQGRVAGAPLNDPNRATWDGYIDSLYEYATTGNVDNLLKRVRYVETQIQGGVSLADVSHVIDREGFITATQRAQLAERGIEVRSE